MKKLSHFIKKPEGKFIAGLILVIVVLFAYYFYAMRTYTPVQVEDLKVSETDHVRGALDGSVTLVEFGDFQCPACSAYEPFVQQLVKDNSKILKVVFRHFPLTQIHQNALLAAKASEAASLQGKFWEMHDIIYAKQNEWSEALNARDIFSVYATTIGLDTKKFSKDLNSKEIEDKILAEYSEGIKLGVMGTPTFFINGKMIENPQSIEAFDRLIKDAAN
ncbi:MAG: thioredoxin domain-containing protein [Candidatus Paceibacterota bacterium]|jgi:protein-disulfide isomerase